MRASVLRRLVPLFALASLTAFAPLCPTASGEDFVRETLPNKWVERYQPEKLPDLEFPAYFSDLDKAKAQAFAGRYKLSLISLYKLKNVKESDHVDVALARGRSLGAIGKKTEAIAVLSDPKVGADAQVRIVR